MAIIISKIIKGLRIIIIYRYYKLLYIEVELIIEIILLDLFRDPSFSYKVEKFRYKVILFNRRLYIEHIILLIYNSLLVRVYKHYLKVL